MPILFRFLLVVAAACVAPASIASPVQDCVQRENKDHTIEGCTKVLAQAKNGLEKAIALFRRGLAFVEKGDNDRGILDFDQAIRFDATNASLYLVRGNAYTNKGEAGKAISDYDRAISLNPEFSEAYLDRGVNYMNQGDNDRAIKDFDRALVLDPKSAAGYCIRGIAYFHKTSYAQALSDLNRGIELHVNNRDCFYYRGGAYHFRGYFAQAIADYDQALSIDPNLSSIYVARANANREYGQYPQAFADYEHAIHLNPKDSDAYGGRAELYARTSELEKALADANKAVEISTGDASLHAYRAYILGRKGNINEAIPEIEAAQKLDANNLDVILYRGELHLMKGEMQAALADFEAVLAKFPSSRYARAGFEKAQEGLPPQARKPLPPAQPVATLQAPAAPGIRVALVIGNARYDAQATLKNPHNDATAVAAALRASGFKTVVTAENLSRDALVKALQQFQDKADAADWALIYFSGHGLEIGGTNYVVPTDARLKTDRNVADEAVSLNRLMDSVAGAKKLHMVILDACRENPFAHAMQRTIAFKSASKGLALVEPMRATLVVYAARDGQLAQDGDGDNSPFAAALAKRLVEPHLEVTKLFRLVTDDVLDATDRRQQPFVYGSLPGREDFYFRP